MAQTLELPIPNLPVKPTDLPAPPTPVPSPEVRAAQRWNIVWVVPILAVLIGGWLVFRSISSQGPIAEVRFETASGLSAGKTEVRCRSVRVGVVKDVQLAKDLASVIVKVQMDPEARELLREGSVFWVVRPRLTSTEISGVGTLITGAYIEMDPGDGDTDTTKFIGRETPPATSRSIPGRRLSLVAEEGGLLGPGSPIYHRGFEVGRIEARRLDIDQRKVVYDAFIAEEYSALVKTNSRFWNTSGIDITADTEGFRLRTPSFQAMLAGGVTFAVPDRMVSGLPCDDAAEFRLYSDEDAAKRASFEPQSRFLLLFDQSVRGLEKGAPVEFRGLPIGRVAGISFEYFPESQDNRIPVLIEIDSSLLRANSRGEEIVDEDLYLQQAVTRGLRASLKIANLLTGSLYVDLDYLADSQPAEMELAGKYVTLPTVSSGLAHLEAKLTALLDKLQALPVDDALVKISGAADEIAATAVSTRTTLDGEDFKKLPEDLRVTLSELQRSVASLGPDSALQGDLLRTLDELRGSLRAIKSLTNTLDDKPNSLLFGRESSGNPIPRAPASKR